MALVSLETASSTENLRSFKNQRIMSSSSLPFLPVGRPGCSLASRSFTSTTSFARDTVQPTPDKQGQPIVSATHPIPLLMARGSVCRDTDQRSSGGRGVRKSWKCQEASGQPADGRIGSRSVTLEVAAAAPPAPGVAALRQSTALLARLRESGGARTAELKEQEAAIFRRDPAGTPRFLTLRRRIVGEPGGSSRGQPDRRKRRGSARPTSQRVLFLSSPWSPWLARPYAEAQPMDGGGSMARRVRPGAPEEGARRRRPSISSIDFVFYLFSSLLFYYHFSSLLLKKG